MCTSLFSQYWKWWIFHFQNSIWAVGPCWAEDSDANVEAVLNEGPVRVGTHGDSSKFGTEKWWDYHKSSGKTNIYVKVYICLFIYLFVYLYMSKSCPSK